MNLKPLILGSAMVLAGTLAVSPVMAFTYHPSTRQERKETADLNNQELAKVQGNSDQQTAAGPSSLSSASIGQSVFDSAGNEVGTISSVTHDVSGNAMAVISTGQFLGMGSKDVLIPGSSLMAKSGGGFATSISDSAIQALPAYKGPVTGL